jgi:hypothetical protein
MRSTSATKLVHSYEADETGGAPTITAVESVALSSSSGFQLPNFDYGEAAVAARIAGRSNALKVSESEHEGLLLERQLLLDKHFAGTISQRDSNRLNATLDEVAAMAEVVA